MGSSVPGETAGEAAGEAGGSVDSGLPRSLGDYVLLEEIGAGGMGVVYRSLQVSLDRPVALKLLRPGCFLRESDRRRFRAEAEAAARIRHPNIVSVYEVGEHQGQPFYVMELLEGRNLAEVLREGPLEPSRAARTLEQVAEAMHEAHSRGVLHRDLKSSNLFLDPHDRPRVLDFGLAKLISADCAQTGVGVPFGSPSYMPPEQAMGRAEQTDARSDVYSLGAVLYETLTGIPPFRAASAVETMHLVVHQEPVPPRSINPHLPADLETICLKALAKDPTQRYASALALANDLQRFQRSEPIEARPIGWPGRLRLWVRRQPMVAALAGGLLLFLLAGLAALSFAWRREVQLRFQAEVLEARARRNLYAADMNLALQAAERGDFGAARQLLRAYEPTQDPAAPNAGTPRTDLRGFEWRYLRHLIRSDPHRALAGHQDQVTGLAFSADGQRFLSVGSDGWLQEQKWPPVEGATKGYRIGFHASSLAWHPDGRHVAVGGDAAQGGILLDLAEPAGIRLPTNHVQMVTFSPGGHWLLCGEMTGWNGDPGPLLIADGAGHIRGSLPEAGGRAVFAPGGRWLATGSWQGRIRLWRWPSAEAEPTEVPQPNWVRDLQPAGKVFTLSFSHDGTRLVSANEAGDLQLWEVDTGKELQRVGENQSGYPRIAAFSPDDHWIVTGGDDRLLRRWDARTLTVVSTHRGHNGSIWALDWAPDGSRILAASADGAILVWPVEAPPAREIVLTNVFADYYKSALAFSPDSRWLSMGTAQGGLGLWNAHTGEPVAQVTVGTDRLHAAFSADSQELYVSIGTETVQRFSVPDLRILGSTPLQPTGQAGLGAELSPDARWFVGLDSEEGSKGTLRLWDARSGQLRATWRGHASQVRGLRFSPDNRWLASGGLDHTTRLWDLQELKETAVLRGASNAVTVLTFSPDGRTLAAGGWDHTLRLWRIPEGELLSVIPVPDGVPVSEFLPDGETLAITTEATGIRLFNLVTQRDTCTLRWPGSHPYRYVRCSPDGMVLAWYSNDGRLRLSLAPY